MIEERQRHTASGLLMLTIFLVIMIVAALGLQSVGAVLVPLDKNPVDSIWTDQPPLPIAPLETLDIRYAGESSEDKRKRMGKKVEEAGADVSVIGAPTPRSSKLPSCRHPIAVSCAKAAVARTGRPSSLPLISHRASSMPAIAWMTAPLRP